MLLSRRAVAAYLDRRLDDFNWMKSLRRDVLLAELARLRVPPVFKTEPWTHQLVCFYIAVCRPRFLFLLDMGLGKTKILADTMTQLRREKRLRRALIGVPRVINIDSWRDDLARHSDLEPCLCDTSDVEEKRERLLHPTGDVTVIDYAGLNLALTRKEKGRGRGRLVRDDKLVAALAKQYNFIGLDESHKLGNHGNLWFSNMRQVVKGMEFRYATTGTLFGGDVTAVWPQFFLVDDGETFGENLGLFRASLFTQKADPWKGAVYEYNKFRAADLHRLLQHRSLRYDEDEVPELEVPRLRMMPAVAVVMGDEQREHYTRALDGLISAGGELRKLEGAWLRMRQITSGYQAWRDEHGDHVVPFKVNPKMDALEALLDSMGDSKIIVCYDYTETGRMIVERVKALGLGYEWFYGGTRDKSASRERFMRDPDCRVFVMNSEAGGTGNDGLQDVARYMVFYEPPPPPITRKQTIKRIHRPGQKQRTFVYDLVCTRSVDGGILANLAEGIDLYERVVNGGGRQARDFFLM